MKQTKKMWDTLMGSTNLFIFVQCSILCNKAQSTKEFYAWAIMGVVFGFFAAGNLRSGLSSTK